MRKKEEKRRTKSSYAKSPEWLQSFEDINPSKNMRKLNCFPPAVKESNSHSEKLSGGNTLQSASTEIPRYLLDISASGNLALFIPLTKISSH